ncbi:MAG: YdgA family protein [Rhodospirillaceae bacterium]|nr:YdgA family protein [Rhodospirillaceae bacterium]
MTFNRQAGFGRSVLGLGLAALLALTACDKGPDREKVAADLKAGVEEQLKKAEGPAGQQVLSHSAVNVTPQDGDTYLVSIEGLKVQPSTEGYLEVGTVSYVAKPKDETSYEVSKLTVPQSMPFKAPDGTEKGKLVVTTKSFSGVYSKALTTFQQMDAEFADIIATDDQGAEVGLGNAKFTVNVADKGGGVADATVKAILAGLTAKEEAGGLFSVAETQIDAKYDSWKLAEYQAAALTYQELVLKQAAFLEQTATGQSGSGSAQPAALTPEEQKALADAITTMAASIKGGDFKLALKGLKFTEAGAEPFSMGGLTLATVIDGINQEKATLNFDIAHQDLVVTSPDVASPVTQASLPKSGNLSIKISNIPSKDMVKVMTDNLPGVTSGDPAMAQANAMAMVVALQAVFQSSGAKIEIAPSQLLSQLVEIKADGAFDVQPQAVFGIVGGLNVGIRGIDDLLALAQKTPEDYDAQQAMQSIQMLQTYSAREQGADGKPVDSFKIEVNEGGQMTVNGKPM